MNLSKNFTLAELTKSQTALRRGIPNQPGESEIENLRSLCEFVLQPIRDEFGPFIVSSGYRCAELCIAIGSNSLTSQHRAIEGAAAADFEVSGIGNYDLCEWIDDNLAFDQLILECYTPGEPNSGWVHCSYKDPGRQETLTYDRVNGYRPGLISG